MQNSFRSVPASRKANITALFDLLLALLLPSNLLAHTNILWGVHETHWTSSQVSRVIGIGGAGNRIRIAGKDCVSGGFLGFDVRDDYAFDLDETVLVDIDLYVKSASAKVTVSYDGNESIANYWTNPGEPQELTLARESGSLTRHTAVLKRARFANLGFGNTDFAVSTSSDAGWVESIVCGVSIRRSNTASSDATFGMAQITVVDEHGHPTPARVGIYDASGRMPLPSDDALLLRHLSRESRVAAIGPGTVSWPVKNRSAFYMNGRYRARLPVGNYELVVSKGPEYRMARYSLLIRETGISKTVAKLQRWRDMAADGWYSGEDHIHYEREKDLDDQNLRLLSLAEDLRVSNILQMGNNATTYYGQRDWQPIAVGGKAPWIMIPGQEDPRTSHLGHTIALNIRGPIRSPERYLMYHEVFEKVRSQGGLVGYAHVTDPAFTKGMAIDIPFGLVDFVEVMSAGITGTSTWFDYLNLGFKLTPTAGSDFPYVDLPGAVRNYVHVNQLVSAQLWSDELRNGRTFVTNGPMIQMTVNGEPLGSQIQAKSGELLNVEVTASINPDFDALTELELIEQGQPVRVVPVRVVSGPKSYEVKLQHAVSATHGTWFIARARGQNSKTFAVTAPIYVIVDGQAFWKRADVPAIVTRLKAEMQDLLAPVQIDGTEGWETQESVRRYWHAQKQLLSERIKQASALYDNLAVRAATETMGVACVERRVGQVADCN